MDTFTPPFFAAPNTSPATSCATFCATSFACSSFTFRLRAAWGAARVMTKGLGDEGPRRRRAAGRVRVQRAGVSFSARSKMRAEDWKEGHDAEVVDERGEVPGGSRIGGLDLVTKR